MSRSKPGSPAPSIGKSLELLISGQVQRVGYRRVVLRAARKNGVLGYVENLRDETVKVVAQGPPARLRSFISDISVRKEPIFVEGVSEKRLKGTGRYHSFTIRPGRLVDELQEGLGAGEERLAVLTDEFRDYRGEFKDYRKEFGTFADRTDTNFKDVKGGLEAIRRSGSSTREPAFRSFA